MCVHWCKWWFESSHDNKARDRNQNLEALMATCLPGRFTPNKSTFWATINGTIVEMTWSNYSQGRNSRRMITAAGWHPASIKCGFHNSANHFNLGRISLFFSVSRLGKHTGLTEALETSSSILHKVLITGSQREQMWQQLKLCSCIALEGGKNSAVCLWRTRETPL